MDTVIVLAGLPLIDFFTIVGSVGSLCVVGTILYVNHKQLSQKIKIDSATLIQIFVKPWRDNKEFTDFLDEIDNPKTNNYGTENIRMLLDHFEDIAVLWKDRTLKENHILEYFMHNLRQIKKDECIQKYIKKQREYDGKIYDNLLELIKKVN